MASEWQTVRVEDIAEKIAMGPFGSNIKIETFVATGVPVISGAHLRNIRMEDGDFNFVTAEHAERLKNSNVFRGDVIFTHAGNIGQVAYIAPNSQYDRYVISQRQFYLRCDLKKAEPAFISYFFRSAEGQHKLLANASQTGVPSIARPSSYLKTIELALPPLSEQRAIAHILGTLDDKIELNRRRNQTLEAMARALFKDWFVDFGPVRAKMEGREPYLPADLWQLFPDRLVESELGEIPEGWHVSPLDSLLELATARVAVSNLTSENYISTQNMVENRGGVISASSLPSAATVPAFQRGDILVSNIRPYFKKIWLSWFDGGRSPDVLSFRAKDRSYQEFLHSLLSQDEFFDFMMRTSKGAKMPRGDKAAIMTWPLPLPDLDLCVAFSEAVRPFYTDVELATRESDELTQLRDTLLPKLISGELQITDAEKFLERAEDNVPNKKRSLP